jgi:hypothetical protein
MNVGPNPSTSSQLLRQMPPLNTRRGVETIPAIRAGMNDPEEPGTLTMSDEL